MAYSKVTLNGTTIMDVTQDTVNASNLLSGETATRKDGVGIVGEASAGTLITKTITENGTYSAEDDDADGYSEVTVNVASGGRDESIPNLKDVIFVDYDGTVVQQYTKSEFLALDAMPNNPSHSGLVAQGWNWTFLDAKDYVAENGMLVIGQNYTTNDGKTRVYITISDVYVGSKMYIQLTTSVKGGVTIDWGDGTAQATTANANSRGTYNHSYESTGDYIITFTRTDGTYHLGKGTGGSAYDPFLSNGAQASLLRRVVWKVEVGDYVTDISGEAFSGCANLKTISISQSVSVFHSGTRGAAFSESGVSCIVIPGGTEKLESLVNSSTAVRFVSIPKSVTSYSIVDSGMNGMLMLTLPPVATIPGRVFYPMRALQKACAPGTYTTIAYNYTRACALRAFTIPSSVTSIGQYSFTEMLNITEYHFKSATPPALASTSNMFSINTGTKIYVPYSEDHSILDAYKTATNWTSFAQYIEEEPQ